MATVDRSGCIYPAYGERKIYIPRFASTYLWIFNVSWSRNSFEPSNLIIILYISSINYEHRGKIKKNIFCFFCCQKELFLFFFSFKSTDRSAIAQHPIPTPTPSREFRSSTMKIFFPDTHSLAPLTIYHTTPNIDIKFRILFFPFT